MSGGASGEGGAGSSGGSGMGAGMGGQDGASGEPAGRCADGELECDGLCVSKDDARNCGACGRDCTALPHVAASVTCQAGECVLEAASCAAGWSDCAGGAADGCETDLSKPEHCGACGEKCPADAPLCSGGATTKYECVNGCPASAPAKCGSRCVDPMTDVMHCGGCELACMPPANANASCAAGKCKSECKPGYHDCRGTCADDRSPMTCGDSCTPCPTVANARSTCNGSSCGFACNSGFHECNGQCVSNTATATCGNSCSPCPTMANQSVSCDGTQCRYTCTGNVCDGSCVGRRCTRGESCQSTASCAQGLSCDGGECTLRCASGTHECDNQCVSNDDVDHCGTSACSPCAPRANHSVSCNGSSCQYTCTANTCNGTCVARQCTAGETCTGASSCASGLECTGGTCKSTAPVCGDRVITRPQEQCEVGVQDATQFTCGPDFAPEGKRCMHRAVYTVCTGSGNDCGPDSSCQSLDGMVFQCMPNSGLGLDGVGKASDVCPALDIYPQGLFSNAFCVIDCTGGGRCPSQLPVCAINPLASAGPEEAGRFCVPPPP